MSELFCYEYIMYMRYIYITPIYTHYFGAFDYKKTFCEGLSPRGIQAPGSSGHLVPVT